MISGSFRQNCGANVSQLCQKKQHSQVSDTEHPEKKAGMTIKS